jgi:hypothetical protein
MSAVIDYQSVKPAMLRPRRWGHIALVVANIPLIAVGAWALWQRLPMDPIVNTIPFGLAFAGAAIGLLPFWPAKAVESALCIAAVVLLGIGAYLGVIGTMMLMMGSSQAALSTAAHYTALTIIACPLSLVAGILALIQTHVFLRRPHGTH